MQETTVLIVAILTALLTWSATVAGLVLWLTGKFRDVEKTIYREDDKHRRLHGGILDDHAIRIQKLELYAFGFTKAP